MTYITVREAAEKWQISPRLVQKYCAAGRLQGAKKFGVSWLIPDTAVKPQDPRRQPPAPSLPTPSFVKAVASPHTGLMPLMNTPFRPGECLLCLQRMEPGPRQEIAWAEYYYFSGQPERAIQKAGQLLYDPDIDTRLSACLLFVFANLSVGDIQRARQALSKLQDALTEPDSQNPVLLAAAPFTAAAAAVLLHLPLPEGLPPMGDFLPRLPEGLRAFALYVQAHYLYLKEEYEKSLGLVEGTLAMQSSVYPIPCIYLHLVAVMDLMSLRRPEKAQEHLLIAWELSRPDDLIEGLGEHHGLLGGMLEAVIKKDWPDDFKRIIAITYRFSAGWRKIHNPETGHDVADNLTTTEFAAAMLAARGWTNQEIGEHMNISPHTVKRYISTVLQKLNIRSRQELKQYMLR